MRRVGLVALVVVAVVAGACARRPAPQAPSERALFRDLERQVTVSAAGGWSIDPVEVDKLLPAALDSACRVDALDRRALATWLDSELRRLGGPVEVAYRERGRRLSRVADLLVVTRIQKLLARAEERSLDCPFWLEPQHPFRGRQISEHRWQLSVGGGGKGTVVSQGDRTDLQFGGAGRFLLGRTFTGGHGLYAGVELGASAAFPKDAAGERTSLELGLDLVTPIVFRYTLTNAFFEVEGGWLGHATEKDWGALDHGIHVGVALGGRALRQRFVFPGAALGLSWERTFVAGDDVTTLKLGARVVFDLDL